jgi:riboflavin kinase/FMN adenylyltransferase
MLDWIVSTLFRGLHTVPRDPSGCVATLGTFDGVHIGHQALLQLAINTGKVLQLPSFAITFEPQPAELLAPNRQAVLPRLTRFREKVTAFTQSGIDNILVIRFTKALAQLSPRSFVEEILIKRLNIRFLIVGADFRFGSKREGDVTLLRELFDKLNRHVEIMPDLCVEGVRVSSTRIRQALAADQQALVKQLLGRPYTMEGRIIQGRQLGRQLGFPTANIFVHRQVSPVHGIYIVRMHGLPHGPRPGVANIGTRPAVAGTRTLLEVYLFNFSDNIYGQYVKIEFIQKIREEAYYENLALLKVQIAKDADMALRYFVEQGELDD